MKLLQIIGTLDQEYGGPVEALSQSTLALKKLGHYVEVATLDHANAAWLSKFPGVVHALGPSLSKYRYSKRLLPWLKTNVVRFDAVIVRGIWQYQGLATWIASKRMQFPYFVFVHGALDPWFKHKYPLKHLKKWLYWPWAEYRILRDASAVLFTSQEERRLASKSFWLYKANEVVVNYGILMPAGSPEFQRQAFFDAFPFLRDKRIMLFLGRIHPKKGCDILIEAFAQIASKDPTLHLVIAGPTKDGWRSALERIVYESGIYDRLSWTGMLVGDLKWGAFHAADTFILPSHSENFGVAVVEALACGVPVLITDKVNIWQEIKNTKCGLVDTDSYEGVVRLFENWLQLSASERREMKKNAKDCFRRFFELENSTRNFVETLQKFL